LIDRELKSTRCRYCCAVCSERGWGAAGLLADEANKRKQR